MNICPAHYIEDIYGDLYLIGEIYFTKYFRNTNIAGFGEIVI